MCLFVPRVSGLKAAADGFDFGARRRRRYAVPEPPESEPGIPVVAPLHLGSGYDWRPEVLVLRKREALRHDADDRCGLTVEPHSSPDNVRVSRETADPQPVTQDGNRRRTGNLIGGREVSSEHGLLPNQAERIGSDLSFGISLSEAVQIGQRHGDAVGERHVLE